MKKDIIKVGSIVEFTDWYDRSHKTANIIYGVVFSEWGTKNEKSIRIQWFDGKTSLEHVVKNKIVNQDIKIISY